MPEHGIVDKVYPDLAHTNIVSSRDVFNDSVTWIYGNGLPSSTTQALAFYTAQTPTPPTTEEQELASFEGELAAGVTEALSLTLGAVTTATFEVAANAPLSVTLVDPSSQIVTPATPNSNPLVSYSVFSDTFPGESGDQVLYWYTYQVAAPADGVWQMQILGEAAATFGAFVNIYSPTELAVLPSAGSYEPGTTVTLRAGVAERSVLQTGYTISGTVTMPDDTLLPLAFFDDATHGDRRPGDGFYAAQFTAPLVDSHPRITLESSNGSILRRTETLVAVVDKSAAILAVSGERPVDGNQNSYYDALELDVAVAVTTTGEYRLLG